MSELIQLLVVLLNAPEGLRNDPRPVARKLARYLGLSLVDTEELLVEAADSGYIDSQNKPWPEVTQSGQDFLASKGELAKPRREATNESGGVVSRQHQVETQEVPPVARTASRGQPNPLSRDQFKVVVFLYHYGEQAASLAAIADLLGQGYEAVGKDVLPQLFRMRLIQKRQADNKFELLRSGKDFAESYPDEMNKLVSDMRSRGLLAAPPAFGDSNPTEHLPSPPSDSPPPMKSPSTGPPGPDRGIIDPAHRERINQENQAILAAIDNAGGFFRPNQGEGLNRSLRRITGIAATDINNRVTGLELRKWIEVVREGPRHIIGIRRGSKVPPAAATASPAAPPNAQPTPVAIAADPPSVMSQPELAAFTPAAPLSGNGHEFSQSVAIAPQALGELFSGIVEDAAVLAERVTTQEAEIERLRQELTAANRRYELALAELTAYKGLVISIPAFEALAAQLGAIHLAANRTRT